MAYEAVRFGFGLMWLLAGIGAIFDALRHRKRGPFYAVGGCIVGACFVVVGAAILY